MTERIGYKLNPKKLVGAPQGILPYVVGAFYYTEDFEYFDVIKPYLDIPEPPKTLDEISQELDEKFEKLIEQTKEKFECSKYFAGKRYNAKFDKIIENFEYARKNECFPQKLTLDYSKFCATGSSVETSFVIKQGNKHEGYYTIGDGYLRFYMPYKPNVITRWFMDKCLSIRWVDEKND
jgi:translation initiation factor 1 (eIF-1/SUI1)